MGVIFRPVATITAPASTFSSSGSCVKSMQSVGQTLAQAAVEDAVVGIQHRHLRDGVAVRDVDRARARPARSRTRAGTCTVQASSHMLQPMQSSSTT